MNILYMVPYVPSLVRVRPFNLIRSLSELGHKVTVATLWTNEREREEANQLKGYCHQLQLEYLPQWQSILNCLVSTSSSTPLQAVYSWNRGYAERLAELAGEHDGRRPFDVIHVEHLRGVRYGLYLKSKLPEIPVVWDSVDCISYLFKQAAHHSRKRISRWLTHFELGRTERYEGRLPAQFNRTLVTSPTDQDEILALADRPKDLAAVSVLPNGVDLDYFKPVPFGDREEATLVISGKMSYHANVTMVLYLAQAIMPIIWKECPEVKLWVVGKDPPREIATLANNPQIQVTGTVNDIRPYLQRATVAVAPLLYGAGIQNKVLEAMACATPVVSTLKATSALSLQPGQVLLVADEPQGFARHVLDLLGDPTYQQRVGLSGRQFVEKNHHWVEIARRLEGVYREVVYAN